MDHRDPEVMRTHGYHWFDLARMAHDPHPSPIRSGPLLYNIFITRTEGHATGWEELMLAGRDVRRPPALARADLHPARAARRARARRPAHALRTRSTLEQAAAFTSAHTPRGWLSLEGQLVRGEQHLYLRQPRTARAMSSARSQIEQLIGRSQAPDGRRVHAAEVHGRVRRAGLIPISLIRWELTGELSADLKRMLQ